MPDDDSSTDSNVSTLPGMPKPPEQLVVTLSGTDTWLGYTKPEIKKLKVGQTFTLVVEAHVSSVGLQERGDGDVPFIKLRADFVDTDHQIHGARKSPID